EVSLDRRTAVVRPVDAARQLDELGVERALRLLLAQAVLDLPQREVDLFQLDERGGDVALGERRRLPGLAQQVELAADVRELRGIGHPLGLDLEDAELVEELA